MRKTPLARFLLAFLTLGLAACASRGGGAGEAVNPAAEPTGDQIRVQITNDLVPSRTVTVWMVPETGGRRRLGSVPPNAARSFTYAPGLRTIEHRLVAELEGGGSERSNPFTLQGVSGIRWNLSNPRVQLVP